MKMTFSGRLPADHRRGDEILLAEGHGLRADDAGVEGPAGDRQGEDMVAVPGFR